MKKIVRLLLAVCAMMAAAHIVSAFYDPVDGRFLSVDPIDDNRGESRYTFCNGDPVNSFDPDGRCAIDGSALSYTNFNPQLNFNSATGGDTINVSDWGQNAQAPLSNAPVTAAMISAQIQDLYAQAHALNDQRGFLGSLFADNPYSDKADQLSMMLFQVGSGIAAYNSSVPANQQIDGKTFDFANADAASLQRLGISAQNATLLLATLGASEVSSLATGATAATGQVSLVTRYVGPTEAQIAQDTGYIPNVDQYGNAKDVYVTPEAPMTTPQQAASAYQINTPTHIIIGDARGITFNYAGNVEGGSGIEMTTTQQIPVIGVRPFSAAPLSSPVITYTGVSGAASIGNQ